MKTCMYCGCDDAHACEGGCSWADDDQQRAICSQCWCAEDVALKLVEVLGLLAVANGRRPPIVSLERKSWTELEFTQQQLLVMTSRAVVDALRAQLLEGLEEDAAIAELELTTIAKFLLEKCPDQVDGEPSLSAVVIKLLEPHVGARIVLPGGVR